MRPRNQLIVGGVLLLVGLGPLLARRPVAKDAENLPASDIQTVGNPAKSAAPAQSATGAAESLGCPRGQLDDFGVCVPVAQTPPQSHPGR